MKVVEFSEEQLSDLSKIGEELFCDENDPRSPNYKRKLKRPKIKWVNVILFVGISSLIFIALVIILNKLNISDKSSVFIALMLVLVYLLVTLKRITVFAVKMYQRFAPESIRNKCRFEPSCSEYMLMSIEKYGLIKGLKKGICRLKRCNVNHGGYDFP